MKTIFLSSAILLIVFLTFSVASAQGKEEMVAIHGYGKGITSSCAEFVRQTDEKDTNKAWRRGDVLYYPENELYVQWVGGFLTGLSYGMDGRFSTGDQNVNDLVTWIRKYCDRHPLAKFMEAMAALIKEIKK
jgi:hypothetical protein